MTATSSPRVTPKPYWPTRRCAMYIWAMPSVCKSRWISVMLGGFLLFLNGLSTQGSPQKHETNACPEDGPAADHDPSAAAGYPLTSAVQSGSPAGGAGGAGSQSHAGDGR